MKEIKMDFITYEKELREKSTHSQFVGKTVAFLEITEWLESGKRLYDYLESIGELGNSGNRECVSNQSWIRLAKALGREDELKKEKSCQK